ncbi:MAG: TfoX/Sxy family protein [Patescibacteria group bacterium]
MAKDTSFHDYIVYDVLRDISDITSRAMFGGHGVYQQGKIFAIIVDGELYFKANESTKKFFLERASHPFAYSKRDGKTYTMNYWLVGEAVYENRDELKEWVATAINASR